MTFKNKKIYWVVTFIFLLILDQFSKFWVEKNSSIILNKGFSFGLGAIFSQLLIFAIIALICGLFFVFWRKKYWNWGNCFFLVGAISNLIDRIIFGGVRDWMPIPMTNIYNNLADYFIFVGLILMLAKEIIFWKKTS